MNTRELLENLRASRDLLDRQIAKIERLIESEGQADIEDDKAGGLKLMVIDTLRGHPPGEMVSDEEMQNRQWAYLARHGIRTPRQ